MSAEPVPNQDGELELPASVARSQLPDMIKAAEFAGRTSFITRRGKGRVAAVVPIEVVEAAEHWEDLQLQLMARQSVEESVGQPNASWDDVKRELGL